MAFVGNFRKYVEQELAKALAQQGVAPTVPQASDLRFYEQNTQLPAPQPMFPSPHTPDLRGATATPANVAAMAAAAAMAPRPVPQVAPTNPALIAELMRAANAPAPVQGPVPPSQVADEMARRERGYRVAQGLAEGPEHDPARQAEIDRLVRARAGDTQPTPPSDAAIRAYGDQITGTMEDRRALDRMSQNAAMRRQFEQNVAGQAAQVESAEAAAANAPANPLVSHVVDPAVDFVVGLIEKEIQRLPERAANLALDVDRAAQNLRPVIELMGIPFDFVLDAAKQTLAPVEGPADIVGTGAGMVIDSADTSTGGERPQPAAIGGEPAVPGRHINATATESPSGLDVLGELGGTAASAAGDVAGFVATEGVVPALAQPIEAMEGVTGVSPAEAGDFVVNTLLPAFDYPREQVVGVLGEAAYHVAKARENSGGTLTPFEQRLIDAYENGYQVKDVNGNVIAEFGPGGRAVWESGMGETDGLPLLLRFAVRGVADTVTDPFSYLGPLAKVGRTATQAARAASVAGDVRKAAALNVLGQALQLPYRSFDEPFERLFDAGRDLFMQANPYTAGQQVVNAIEESTGRRLALERADNQGAVPPGTTGTPAPQPPTAPGGFPTPPPPPPTQGGPPLPPPPPISTPPAAPAPAATGRRPQPTYTVPPAPPLLNPPPVQVPMAQGPTQMPMPRGRGAQTLPTTPPPSTQPGPPSPQSPPPPGTPPAPAGVAADLPGTTRGQDATGRGIVTFDDTDAYRLRATSTEPDAEWFVQERRGNRWETVRDDAGDPIVYQDEASALAGARELIDGPSGSVIAPPVATAADAPADVTPPTQGASVQTPVGKAVRMPDGTTRTFATVQERYDYLRSIGRDDLTSGPPASPAPTTETPSIVVDDDAGVIAFEGVSDIQVKRTGTGSRTRWAVQELRPGGWRNVKDADGNPLRFKEQSEAVAQGRASILARQGAAIDAAPVPGVTDEGVVAATAPPAVTVGERVVDADGRATVPIGDEGTVRVRQKAGVTNAAWMVQRKATAGGWRPVSGLTAIKGEDEAIRAAQNLIRPQRADTAPTASTVEPPVVGDDVGASPERGAAPPPTASPVEATPEPVLLLPVNNRFNKRTLLNEDLNRPQRRKLLVEAGERTAVMPEVDLGLLDPSTVTDPPTLRHDAAFNLGPQHPARTAMFWRQVTPMALAYNKKDAALRKQAMKALGGNVDDPKMLDTPARALLDVRRFAAEELLYQAHFGQTWPHRFKYGDIAIVDDPRVRQSVQEAGGLPAILEHAIFGTNDVLDEAGNVVTKGSATNARRFLRRKATDKGVLKSLGLPTDYTGRSPLLDLVDKFSDTRAALYGEEALGQSESARLLRQQREGRRDVPPVPGATTDDISRDAVGINPVGLGQARARQGANRLLSLLQPKIEQAPVPGEVFERTRADALFNAGRLSGEDREWFNQEVFAPDIEVTPDGAIRDKRFSASKAGKTPTNRGTGQQTLSGTPAGKLTVLDVVDDLVSRGASERQIDLIVGRLVAEARGVDVNATLKEAGAVRKFLGGWRQFVRENTQFGIHRIASGYLQDAISDAWTASAIGNHGLGLRQFNPFLMKSALWSVQHDDFRAITGSKQFEFIQNLGVDFPAEIAAFTDSRVEVPTSGSTIAGRVEIPIGTRKIKPLAPLASELARDMRTMGDRVRRVLAFDTVFRKEMKGATERFDALLRERAPKIGMTYDDITGDIVDVLAANGKQLPSPEDILMATGDRDLSRAWRQEITRARQAGLKASNKLFFSYKQTRLDKALSTATFFHYWMSRSVVLHTELALRRPRLLATYGRFWEGLKTEAERQGYPDTLRSYIRFMGETTAGWYSYFDPLSLIVPYTMFREMDSQYAEWWEKIGVYMNPMVEAAAAVVGMTDNVPNLTGTSGLESQVMAVWNFLKAEGKVGSANPDQGVFRTVTEGVIDLANRGIRAAVPAVRDFAPFDTQAYAFEQIDYLIEARATELYGPFEGRTESQHAEVKAAKAAARVDANSNPLSAWAFGEWAKSTLTGRVVAWLFPNRRRLAVRDETKQTAGEGWDAYFSGEDMEPDEQSAIDLDARVTSGDPELVALDQRYRNLGSDQQQDMHALWVDIAHYEEGDEVPSYESVSGVRYLDIDTGQGGPIPNPLLVGTTNQRMVNEIHAVLSSGDEGAIRGIVRNYWTSLPAEVHDIERILALTPEERSAFADQVIAWMGQSNELTAPGGQAAPLIALDDLAAMDQDARFDLADRVIAQTYGPQGLPLLQAYRAERDAFREANPRYAEYNDWQSKMYDWPGGALAAAEYLREFAPNYDAYLRAREERGPLTEGTVTSVDAYLADQGEQWDIYTPARDATDPTAIPASNFMFGDGGGSGSGSGSGGEKDPAKTEAEKEADRIIKDLTEYEAWQAAADQVVGQMRPGVTYDMLEARSKDYVDAQLAAAGLDRPSLSSETELFIAWRAAQPAGADTSVLAFLRYMSELEGQKADELGIEIADEGA